MFLEADFKWNWQAGLRAVNRIVRQGNWGFASSNSGLQVLTEIRTKVGFILLDELPFHFGKAAVSEYGPGHAELSTTSGFGFMSLGFQIGEPVNPIPYPALGYVLDDAEDAIHPNIPSSLCHRPSLLVFRSGENSSDLINCGRYFQLHQDGLSNLHLESVSIQFRSIQV